MNKTELVADVAEKAGLSKRDAEKAVNAVFESITESLKAGDKVSLVGFGTFDVKERADGTPVIMECNPRATAGVSEFTASGVNLLYLNIKRCLGEPIPELTPKYGVIMKRRYMEMYSDGT